MSYAELHCLSNFTFLHGASHPEELVRRAAELGYSAIAITDECSLAGVVRAHNEAKVHGIKLLIGSTFRLREETSIAVLAQNRGGYAALSQLITRARRRSPKGEYELGLKDLKKHLRNCLVIWLPERHRLDEEAALGAQLAQWFPGRMWVGAHLHWHHSEQEYLESLYGLGTLLEAPLVACGNVHMHIPARKPLQDVLTAIRHNTSVEQLGHRLMANAEHYLRPRQLLQSLYPKKLLQETTRVAAQCNFSLDTLRYEYPGEVVPEGKTPSEYLRELVEDGAQQRWPEGTADSVRQLIEKELALIAELQYEHYFLTVYDIVQFARSQQILCQGRGSAANSAVCYCLFITSVNPAESSLLFERFISRERDEPPDIDVDFEHERREEVIQYIYRKYGRERAALAATVISYRARSAVRDVGKALGLGEELVAQLARSLSWRRNPALLNEKLQEAGIDLQSRIAQQFVALVEEIVGFPRHLSQHVGGFVIAKDTVSALVPVENAAMEDRTIIQWDKDDLESLKLLKVDVLALGMLSAIRKSLGYISGYLGRPFELAQIPRDDKPTYDMLCEADSIGVFQVESRAQMSMLPRLRPQCFYDLVIEIAIIRPGPIQGGMVHPFLRRRQGLESPEQDENYLKLRNVLARTLGVPIFQEQVIQIAMEAADFSGGEADQLRRAMGSWGKNGNLLHYRQKLIDGMLANGYSEDYAGRLFEQMKGFGDYGFPESHSASFALLAYASAWIKRHHPAAFFCGLLNSLPMGFYSASQLIQDARRHHVEILPVCVNHSDWDHTLIATSNPGKPQLRLGLRLVRGLARQAAETLLTARGTTPFASIGDLNNRCRAGSYRLSSRDLDCLAHGDALHSLSGHRHQSQWEVSAIEESRPLLVEDGPLHDGSYLPTPLEVEEVSADYQHLGLSLRRHPLALLRTQHPFSRCTRAADLAKLTHGRFVRICGLVTCRQRPSTAAGVLFMTLEDETGNSNIVVWEGVQERHQREILRGKLLLIKGTVQRTESRFADGVETTPVIHVVAGNIQDLSDRLTLDVQSHDFH
ncbi:error-prone DNA polymerase [Biformimicrobium ophioploci]|uniref:Error-prone DNA polymerase n=1 Tax=Biformimicrobium ophioploci TaxID=3036711 RepID=A0ABQ6LYQ4_9GAMM|nr:error-prone DNA polymerase [Microbulbifer sp. NKW57]GMG87224.1 error-prone DNA polymerase [Microbulbifer sp. NKW57]